MASRLLLGLTMNTFTIPASPKALDDRADTGGGLCALCQVCADHGIGHACITQPGPSDTVLIELPRNEIRPLLLQLAAHPARPLNGDGERRGVDRTWCFCGCTTDMKETEQ